jgi:periplasmic protein TonB
MKVGISPGDWAKYWANYLMQWLREPIAQALLFSLALHLAFAVVFQAAPGANGGQTMVINARLQQAASLSPQLSQEEPAVAVMETKSGQPAALLSATSPSPVSPIVQSVAPAKEATASITTQPVAQAITPQTFSQAPVAAAASGSAALSDAAQSSLPLAEKPRVGPPSTGLPSLPIGIDTNWYLARQVDNHPKAIGLIEPVYPEEAKRRNIEGSLKLMLKIDDLGRVQSAEVVEATPPGVFDEAALAAFRGAHFRPAMKDGRPVRYQAYIRVEFKLKD